MSKLPIQNSSNQQDAIVENYNPAILPDMLPLYYKRLFPHKPFYRWLSYGLCEKGVFVNRELSFTLKDDIYIRYLSFENQNEMEKEICSRNPYKIDIGAVMSTRPSNFRRGSSLVVPIQRELVFDIDMTDYDDVRTCCNGADVCRKCWKFMALASRILDAALREDFGFEHILWVFSGRRGIHCWVCDYDARHLDIRNRSSVAEYFQIIRNVIVNDNNIPRAKLGERMHHSVRRALKFIGSVFDEIVLEDQNLFGSPKGVFKLLQMIQDERARKDVEVYLRKIHGDGADSKDVWNSFIRYSNSMRNTDGSIWSRKLKYITEEIQLCLLYPRLDINVTKGFNHLLKAPFCIHPATGKVCLPFSSSAATKFDPTTVPTIGQLLQEINAFDDKTKTDTSLDGKSRIKDYKKTSMLKGLFVFEEFLRKLENNLRSKVIEMNEQKMTF